MTSINDQNKMPEVNYMNQCHYNIAVSIDNSPQKENLKHLL